MQISMRSYVKNIEISKLKSPNQDFKLKFDIDKSELVLYGEKLTLENRKLLKIKGKSINFYLSLISD